MKRQENKKQYKPKEDNKKKLELFLKQLDNGKRYLGTIPRK